MASAQITLILRRRRCNHDPSRQYRCRAMKNSALLLVLGILGGSGSVAWAQEDYLPPGKWALDNGNFVCVPPGNRAPDKAHIEAQFAADSSTGDFRWTGTCSATTFKPSPHGFEARLKCSQTYGANGRVEDFTLAASGVLSAGEVYTVRSHSSSGGIFVNSYHRVADTCSLDPKKSAIGPDAPVSQPLNSWLQFLEGFPSSASTSLD